MMPPSPRLLARSTRVTYLSETTIISVQKIADTPPMNTAIAGAADPVLMAGAMKKAVEAGREAFRAGRVPRKFYAASPSSPTSGLIG